MWHYCQSLLSLGFYYISAAKFGSWLGLNVKFANRENALHYIYFQATFIFQAK